MCASGGVDDSAKKHLLMTLYRLYDLGPTGLLMPVIYSIRKNANSPELFVGARLELPAMADSVVYNVYQAMRQNNNDFESANITELFAGSLLNRYRALNGPDFAIPLNGWDMCGLRVRVVLDGDQNQRPSVSGEIAAYVKDGEPYKREVGEDTPEGVEAGWLPFAFA